MPIELSAGEKVIKLILKDDLKNFAIKEEMNSRFNDIMDKLNSMCDFMKETLREMIEVRMSSEIDSRNA